MVSTDEAGAAAQRGPVVGLDALRAHDAPLVGGKAARLGELGRLAGFSVPDGVCITTDVFRSVVLADPRVARLLSELTDLGTGHPRATELARSLREAATAVAVPAALEREIADRLGRFGAGARFAVRSSSTIEDSDLASFAGQFDSFLHVPADQVVDRVRLCWASAFGDGALALASRWGEEVGALAMAVIVQAMVDADASGVAFTADPVTSDRRVVAIEAVPGLAADLVAGRTEAGSFRVRGDAVSRVGAVDRPDAGATLTDDQAIRIASVARHVQDHFGSPQDVEWCLDGDRIWIVQSRPITTLFPVPPVDDGHDHVFVSVGHQQMMTDAIRPLGISLWQMTAGRPMLEAGSRLFVDVSALLASPAIRPGFVAMFERSDPLIGGALRSVAERDDLDLPAGPDRAAGPPPGAAPAGAGSEADLPPSVVANLTARARGSIDEATHALESLSGPAVFDFIEEDVVRLKELLTDPTSHRAVMAGMEATWWLDEHLEEWLGEVAATDTLSLAVPGNISTEMALALLDVADAVRPHPAAIAVLEGARGPEVLDDLLSVPGGREAREAIDRWLAEYGDRGIGEIDVTRPRWRDRPEALAPLILSDVRSFEPGERARRVARGREQAEAKRSELLDRLRALPDGEAKATLTDQAIERLRAFGGYREFPKFAIVCRYAAYRRALVAEARSLVADGVLDSVDDAFHLYFEELREAVASRRVDRRLIAERRAEFRAHERLSPPRVMTSHGEVITGSYGHASPGPDVLVGLPVSHGTFEGRARVVVDPADADLGPDDVLVTTFTDPGWTALFASVGALVTEVGGQMTHGAVIARELGMPAVVGVQHATREIRDGQRVRVDGTRGLVELL